MIFTPRPYQKLIGDFVLDHPRCNVWAGMGMGKTSESIAIFDALRLFGEAKRCLVIAPKRVARSTWANEVQKWRESFGHLTIAAAIGTQEQRIAALRSKPDIVCINYDNIEWLIEIVGEHWPWDMVIADEATRLKGLRIAVMTSKLGNEFERGQGSVRAKALAKVAFKRVRRWVNLTGSPAPNGVKDLWGQQFFIDRGAALGSSFTAFQNRWFRSVPNSSGYTNLEPLPFAQKQIEDAIRKNTITVDPKDWFDIKAPIERHIYIDLPPKARAIYKDMERKLFAEIEEGTFVEAFDGAGRQNKCLQIGNGFAFTDTGVWSPIHDEKIEALKSIVEETNGAPLLVVYGFVPDKERILKAFPRARTLDDKGAEEAFLAGDLPMLVVHPASAGHGLNLQQSCWICVDYSTGWNLEYDEQVVERVGPMRQLQSGFDRAVFRYRIVARDTVEESAAIPRIKTKASVQDSLKAAMKITC